MKILQTKSCLIIAGFIALTLISGGNIAMADTENVPYTVVTQASDGIEIRDYKPVLIAEVTTTGPRKDAINSGFRALADFIFGKNTNQKNIAMTAPVMQQKQDTGTQIAMTAPVMQQAAKGETGNTWVVQFAMPANYTKDTLPRPLNPDIRILETPATRMAVIRFSGIATDAKLTEKTATLMAYIKGQNYKPLTPPQYAFFNPPWTLPFFRRNEVMVGIAAP